VCPSKGKGSDAKVILSPSFFSSFLLFLGIIQTVLRFERFDSLLYTLQRNRHGEREWIDTFATKGKNRAMIAKLHVKTVIVMVKSAGKWSEDRGRDLA
jgi:hypothetical protein